MVLASFFGLGCKTHVVRDCLQANPRPVVDVLKNTLKRSEPSDQTAQVIRFLTRCLANERALNLADLLCLGLVEEDACGCGPSNLFCKVARELRGDDNAQSERPAL